MSFGKAKIRTVKSIFISKLQITENNRKLGVSKNIQGVVIRDILYGRERNCLKTSEQVTSILFLHVILFRVDKRDSATDKT